MRATIDSTGLDLDWDTIYTTPSGRRAFIVATGPEDGSAPFHAVRDVDGRVRLSYLNADGTQPTWRMTEYGWAYPTDLTPSGVMPAPLADTVNAKGEQDMSSSTDDATANRYISDPTLGMLELRLAVNSAEEAEALEFQQAAELRGFLATIPQPPVPGADPVGNLLTALGDLPDGEDGDDRELELLRDLRDAITAARQGGHQ